MRYRHRGGLPCPGISDIPVELSVKDTVIGHAVFNIQVFGLEILAIMAAVKPLVGDVNRLDIAEAAHGACVNY
ncbi:hypothetical protein [Pantoea ananatis]|jgi:hypothetical protein|uniref:hypothetical protein n=1 Tax=Pantoea ananas TaxID=553 RepID=UPI003C1A2740